MTEKMTLEQAEKAISENACGGCKMFQICSHSNSYVSDKTHCYFHVLEAARVVIAAREAERDEARRDAFVMARRSNIQMHLSDSKNCPDAIAMMEKYSEATDENTK